MFVGIDDDDDDDTCMNDNVNHDCLVLNVQQCKSIRIKSAIVRNKV